MDNKQLLVDYTLFEVSPRQITEWSRGMGSVKEVMREAGNAVEVQPDFELIAFDFVSNPSTHGAFLSPVNEAVQKLAADKYSNINNLITNIITEF